MDNNKGSNGILQEGTSLYVGEKLYSKNEFFYAKLQEDGNFVVYYNTHPHKPHWAPSPGTNVIYKKLIKLAKVQDALNPIHRTPEQLEKEYKPYKVKLQSDGNFLIYSNTGYCVWDGDHIYSSKDAKDSNVHFELELTDFGQLLVIRYEKNKEPTIFNRVNPTTAEIK